MEEYKGYKINIEQDSDPINPRENDNFGTMICLHKSYDLGDKHDIKSDDFEGWDTIYQFLEKEKEAIIILPLYLYDHSGISMKVGNFQGLLSQGHVEFDSGQVGFIYCTKKNILDNWNKKIVTKSLLKLAEKLLRGEVEDYDKYIYGDIYQYNIEDTDGEIIESCGGYYETEEILKEAKAIIEADIKKPRYSVIVNVNLEYIVKADTKEKAEEIVENIELPKEYLTDSFEIIKTGKIIKGIAKYSDSK